MGLVVGLGLGLGLVFLKHVLTCAQLKLLYREYQTMVPCSRLMFVLKIQVVTHFMVMGSVRARNCYNNFLVRVGSGLSLCLELVYSSISVCT